MQFGAKRSAVPLARVLSVCSLSLLMSARPLVLYQGDSIVEKQVDGGYGRHALPFWDSLGIDSDVFRSTAKGVNGRECSVPHSINNFYQFVLKPTRDTVKQRLVLLHFNQGIDEVEGMGGEGADFDTYKRDRLISFADDLGEYFGYFQRNLPTIPFVHAASTRPDSVTSDRFRYDIILLNDTARAVCKRFNIPFNDLYQYCVDLDLKTFDGRHFRSSVSKATISPRTVEFSKPYVSDPQVYVTGINFNQSFREGVPVTMTAYVANSADSWTVAYYAGTTKIGESSTAPFAVTWNAPPPGEHMIRAEAAAEGTVLESRYVPISVYQFPLKINVGGETVGDYLGDKFFYEDGVFGYTSHWNVVRRAAGSLGGIPDEVTKCCRTQRSGDDTVQYSFALPAGTYRVSVVAYDPAVITINGKALSPTAGRPARTVSGPVSPASGRVTLGVKGSGSGSAKICAIELEALEVEPVTVRTTVSAGVAVPTISYCVQSSALEIHVSAPMRLRVVRADGRTALARALAPGRAALSLASLPAGAYLVTLAGTGGTETVARQVCVAAR